MKRKYYEIVDLETGEKKILAKQVILKEINRLSDSEILPYSKRTLLKKNEKKLKSIRSAIEDCPNDKIPMRAFMKKNGCNESDIILAIWAGHVKLIRTRPKRIRPTGLYK